MPTDDLPSENEAAKSLSGAINVSDVTKDYVTETGTVHALSSVNMDIPRGKFIVLLGPSGCGKTTLLRILGGLVTPTSGNILIDDAALWKDGRRDAALLDSLAMVFQDSNLFPWMNVEDNISLPLRVRGKSKSERRARARELCKLVGIEGFERKLPRELSGGMRQRAAIGRGLSYDPEILLMDEPFGALDALTRDQMSLEIQRIWMEQGTTVVFVTHSISEAVFLADTVYLFSARPGRIVMRMDVDYPRPRSLDLLADPEFQNKVLTLRSQLTEV